MSIERTFYCDAAECGGHVRTARSRPQASFLIVTQPDAGPLHFCNWDCVLRYAVAQEPVEVIPFDDAGSKP